MATLTKKDLLEAIEDMPIDAEIGLMEYSEDGAFAMIATKVEYIKKYNLITIC
jgi:hypothetical protein